MKKGLTILFLIILESGFSYSQVMSKDSIKTAKAHIGYDIPEYIITFEVIPLKSTECNFPMNTAIFELAVTEDYYYSVNNNQEITSWFKTNEGTILMGSFPPSPNSNSNRWKLLVRDKKIVTKNN